MKILTILSPRRCGFLFFSILVSLLFITQSSQAAFFDPRLKWQTIKTEHFAIHFHNGEEEVAFKMAGIAERVYAKLSPQLQWKPWGRTEVVLTDHTDVSNAFASTLPYNYMLLFISSPRGNSSLNFYDDWLEELFTHEFTHILQIDKYGGIAKPFRWIFGKIITPNGLSPGWVREGIAVFEESKNGRGRNHNSFSDMILRTGILNNEFLTISQASGVPTEWPAAHVAYIYGGAFWQYLADTYGEETITEFITRYGDSMWFFSLNNKARKTYDNKNFLKLWSEWKESLIQKYQKVKAELETKGLTPLKTITQIKGNLFAPTLSPDGQKLVYSQTDMDKSPQIRMIDLNTQEDTLLVKGRGTESISFSPDGKKIAYGSLGTYKYFYSYYDLYELDLATKQVASLTRGKRASDPDYSPDGKSIIYVENRVTGTQLSLYDRESKKEKQITEASPFTQFSNPRFSPDGSKIVVSAWMNGNRDIYVYNLEGKIVLQLTHDKAIDNEPRWSKDANWIYYTSDRSGISNIYRQALNSSQPEALTNVLTGLFYPQPSGDGGKLYVQHYFGKGYNIVAFDEPALKSVAAKRDKKKFVYRKKKIVKNGRVRWVRVKEWIKPDAIHPAHQPHSGGEGEAPSALPMEGATRAPVIEKYNPFRKLFVPRFVMPGFIIGTGNYIFSANIGSSDPLGRHIWTGGMTYRTDAQFLGGDFLYTYNRWWTPLYVGFNDYVLDYGDIFRIGTSFFEEHKRVFAGIRIPPGRHKFDIYYSFENRSDQSGLPDIFDPFLNFGNFAGFTARYTFNRASKFPAGISLEGGPRLSLSLEINDRYLGSGERNETKIIEGDIREYFRIPGTKHHVFALRASGGYNFGDKLFQGVFRLGSDLGESLLSERTPHLYPLRGLPQITFAGDGALLFSGEYRLPLVTVDRGAGTGPIYLKNLYMAFFGDYGTVFNDHPSFSEFLLGVGTELRGDMILGYGIPITGRLGYAIIVKGREFLGNLTDPLTGASIKNGTIILQVGTSF